MQQQPAIANETAPTSVHRIQFMMRGKVPVSGRIVKV